MLCQYSTSFFRCVCPAKWNSLRFLWSGSSLRYTPLPGGATQLWSPSFEAANITRVYDRYIMMNHDMSKKTSGYIELILVSTHSKPTFHLGAPQVVASQERSPAHIRFCLVPMLPQDEVIAGWCWMVPLRSNCHRHSTFGDGDDLGMVWLWHWLFAYGK